MAEQDSYIEELPAASALDGTEQVPMFQSDLTVQATLAVIRTWLQSKGYLPRETQVTSSAAPQPNIDTTDLFSITQLATNCTIGSTTGTPTAGQRLTIRIKDDGTSRTLGFHASYRFSSSLAAPAATTNNKTMYLEFMYNSRDSKWDCINFLDNF